MNCAHCGRPEHEHSLWGRECPTGASKFSKMIEEQVSYKVTTRLPSGGQLIVTLYNKDDAEYVERMFSKE